MMRMIPFFEVLDAVSQQWAAVLGRASWQGGLAVLIVWCICRLGPRMSPRFECWLWRLAYVKVLVALCWPAPIELPLLPASSVGAQQTAVTLDSIPVAERPTAPQASAPLQPAKAHQAAIASPAEPTNPSPGMTAGASWRPLTWLMLLWALGSCCALARVASSWRRCCRWRRSGLRVVDGEAGRLLSDLCPAFGLRRAPLLLESQDVGTPLLAGIVRPAVVLPTHWPAGALQ